MSERSPRPPRLQNIGSRPVLVGAVVAIVGVAVVVGGLVAVQSRGPVAVVASPTVVPSPSASPSPAPTRSPAPSPSPSPTPAPTPEPTPDPLVGADGRFTVLLLGSDARYGHAGSRTDTIMVVSVDAANGKTAVASIPRDTARFPLPDGGEYKPKVNGLYQSLASDLGRTKAGREMKRIIGSALGVEIDYYAIIGFNGVRRLVDAVGGVTVDLPRAVHDPYYWVTARQRGVSFKAGKNRLDGDRALILARTRKGDSDYSRARRQQLLVAAAAAKVLDRGVASLPDLIELGRNVTRTDLPLARAPEVFSIAQKADLDTSSWVVFKPRGYAVGIGGYSNRLKLDKVRGWVDKAMAPAASPVPAAAPSAAPSAKPGSSAKPSSGGSTTAGASGSP